MRRNRRRVNDSIAIFKLPRALHRRARTAAKRSKVSKSKLIRTAVVRLLAELDAGKRSEINWR